MAQKEERVKVLQNDNFLFEGDTVFFEDALFDVGYEMADVRGCSVTAVHNEVRVLHRDLGSPNTKPF